MQKHKAYIIYLAGLSRLGDRAAFEKLVRHFGPRLFGHAYRLLGHREEARDVVQDAWIEIARGLPKLRDDSAFMAWAYRITSRRVAQQIGSNVKARALRPEMPAPNAIFEDAGAVQAAIARLKPAHGATIRLFYLEEMSLREVAMAMDVPMGTVKSRLFAARNQLKPYLEGYENEKH